MAMAHNKPEIQKLLKEHVGTDLLDLAEAGETSILRSRLEKGQLADTRNQHGTTPLMVAARAGQIETVRELIEAGADVNAITNYGATPLLFAIPRSHVDIVRILIEHGAFVAVSDDTAINPMLAACRTGQPTSYAARHHVLLEQHLSIEQLYTNVIAPGLTSQPGFVQFGEGVRISPSLAGGHVRLSYFAKYQQFQAPSDSLSSFQRWTVDLNHEFPIYGSSIPGGKDHNTPNDCSTSPSDRKCPPVALSRNRSGSFGFRALLSHSVVSGGAQVPFYFQQTLGGSDLDGNRVLPSYEDYRFRGPHLVLLQETFEHSLFGSPIGIWLSADQGKVLRQNDALSYGDMAHSFAVGFSLRAGGMPVGLITFATGPEGHHFAITISPTLLGGSSRPALQ